MAEQNYSIRANLIGDASSLNAALSRATTSLNRFSRNVKNIGTSLSRNLTLPLGIAGAAAVKTALDFDKSMTKITTLVGISTDEVNKMRDSVRRLAVDTGVSSNSAADALFFVTSAGLRGSEAMEVLEAAAKASAIGLGEVKTVADAVTSAVNAYGIENLSAEQATDVLTAAVREGKLEADSLAQSMGKVLPVSSQLGVRFDEVGAALAAMSRTGTDAAMASTSLRGILSALLNPSKQANDELESLGLSAEGLRIQLREQGLLATLKTLTESFGDNEEAAGKVFGNIRALTGVLDLMGKNVGATEQIFSNMENTTGTLNQGFSELENSLSFQFRQSLESIRTSFGKLGETLGVAVFPILKKVTDFLTSTINKFNNLDSSTKNLILTLGGIALAIGPAITIIGSLGVAISALFSPIGLVIAGIIGIGLAIDDIVVNFDIVKLKIEKWAEKLKIIFGGVKETFKNIFNLGGGTGTEIARNVQEALDIVTKKYDDLISQIDTEDSIAETIIKGITNAYNNIKNASAGIGNSINNGLKETITTVSETATEVGQTIAKNIAGGFGSLSNFINQGVLASLDLLKEQYDSKVKAIAESQVQFLQSAMQSLIGSLSSLFVNAFSGATNSLRDFTNQILSLLGDLAIKVGTLVIANATAIKAMFTPLGIAAGAALIAIGSALKGLANKTSEQGVTAFANGGIVSGPTLGLVGEYAGARHNPEVIAPLNKLRNMIGDRGTTNVTGEFVIRGQDLVVALQRAERNRNRFK